MPDRIAIKRLTSSDLTLFEWQFRNKNAGNQKSINLNANVFIDELYPSLPETEPGRAGRIALDLYLYGPGYEKEWNLQRKIIKGRAYKNWRLNGEYISNPDDRPQRFNVLEPDDFVVFEFQGELFPYSAKAVFVAANSPEDASLHAAIAVSNIGSMASISSDRLSEIVRTASVPSKHPIHELLLDADLEDASQGGRTGTQRLFSRQSGRGLSREELDRARRNAEDVGRVGEEFIDAHLATCQEAMEITAYEWVSNDNAVSPFDFRVESAPGVYRLVEVKSTRGAFERRIHISISELCTVRDGGEPYDVYRVYDIRERSAKLRVAENVRQFTEGVLSVLEKLQVGVEPDGISVKPDCLPFGPALDISIGTDEDNPDEINS